MNDYFFRVVCLTFEAAVLRELESSPTQTKHIGNDLISKCCWYAVKSVSINGYDLISNYYWECFNH